MNKLFNLEFVKKSGDMFQLEFGCEFGFFAHKLNRQALFDFCRYFNADTWIYTQGYYLSTKYSSNSHYVTLVNEKKFLRLQVKLLDHSAYIEADESDWLKIDDKTFKILQNSWRKFLGDNVEEYAEHMRKLSILSDLEPTFVI